MKQCTILVPKSCRSDEFINPVITRLQKDLMFNCIVPQIESSNMILAYKDLYSYLVYNPDLIFITGDRIEMVGAAFCAFYNNVPIAHYGSGITNYPLTTYDDKQRHCITLLADIALCEDYESKENVRDLWWLIARKGFENIHDVGSCHLDDLEFDNSILPDFEYDLILYNPTTLYKEEIPSLILKEMYRNTIWIGPNPDPSFVDLEQVRLKYNDKKHKFIYYANLPRPKYLSLLKNCKRVIGNSSSMYYEAPEWHSDDEIIFIGDRNKNRSTPKKLKKGGSDKIIEVLRNWWILKQNNHNEKPKDFRRNYVK